MDVQAANTTAVVSCDAAEVTARTAQVASVLSLVNALPTLVAVGVVTTIADSRGRKVGLVVASAGLALSSVAMLAVLLLRANFGETVSVWWMIVPQLLSGVTGGYPVFIASAFAYVADLSERSARGARFALLEFVLVCGNVAGPLVAGQLTRRIAHGFEWFFGAEVVLAVALVAYCASIEESMRPDPSAAAAPLAHQRGRSALGSSGAAITPLLAADKAALVAAASAETSAAPGAVDEDGEAEEDEVGGAATITPWSEIEWCDANIASSLYITIATHDDRRTRLALSLVAASFVLQFSASTGMLSVGVVLSGQSWGWGTDTIGEWMSARALVCALATLGASAALHCCAGVEAHARRARAAPLRNADAGRRYSSGHPQVLRGFGGSVDGRGDALDAALFSNLDASFLAAQRDGGDSAPRSPAKSASLTISAEALLSSAAAGRGDRVGGGGSGYGAPRHGHVASGSTASANGEGGYEGAHGTAAPPRAARALRLKCCDALVALHRCARCGRGATLGAPGIDVGTNELAVARWATAVGALAFLAAATTPKLVHSPALFWIATLLASAQRMAIPCVRSIFSSCANDALQGQALGAVAALEVVVSIVSSPAYLAVFHATAALDAPLTPTAPSGSGGSGPTPWTRLTTFLSGALAGPSCVIYISALLSATALLLLCFVSPRMLRKDAREVDTLGRRAIGLRAALREAMAPSRVQCDSAALSSGAGDGASIDAAAQFYLHRHGGLSAFDLACIRRSREVSGASTGSRSRESSMVGSPSSDNLLRRRREASKSERGDDQRKLSDRFRDYEVAHKLAKERFSPASRSGPYWRRVERSVGSASGEEAPFF